MKICSKISGGNFSVFFDNRGNLKSRAPSEIFSYPVSKTLLTTKIASTHQHCHLWCPLHDTRDLSKTNVCGVLPSGLAKRVDSHMIASYIHKMHFTKPLKVQNVGPDGTLWSPQGVKCSWLYLRHIHRVIFFAPPALAATPTTTSTNSTMATSRSANSTLTDRKSVV